MIRVGGLAIDPPVSVRMADGHRYGYITRIEVMLEKHAYCYGHITQINPDRRFDVASVQNQTTFVMRDGGKLCYRCVNDNIVEINGAWASREYEAASSEDAQWDIVGAQLSVDDDVCDHCHQPVMALSMVIDYAPELDAAQ